MLDYSECTIDGDNYQGNGNGYDSYDKLDGEWLTYYKIGNRFTGKVKPEDKEDFLHNLFLSFATDILKVETSFYFKSRCYMCPILDTGKKFKELFGIHLASSNL